MNKFSFGFQRLNFTSKFDSEFYSFLTDEIILCIFSILICIFGLVGNGVFLWLLTSNLRRNVFAIYLLNFSFASFGFLLIMVHVFAHTFLLDIDVYIDTRYVAELIPQLLLMTHNSSQFILSIMSIDRCVSVLYPNWYLQHKSPNFPTIMCFLIWGLSFLMLGINLTILASKRLRYYYGILSICWLLVPFFLCFLVVSISALTLFVKVQFKSHPQQCGALITAVLLTLFFFLLLDALAIIMVFWGYIENKMLIVLSGCSLVSSINPVLYFLVGRWKGSQLQESMRVILNRVFKEDDSTLPSHTQLQSLH